MDAKTFLDEFGREEAEAVATAAGTNYAYFHQLAKGLRDPSKQLAKKLAEASGYRMKVLDLLGLSEAA